MTTLRLLLVWQLARGTNGPSHFPPPNWHRPTIRRGTAPAIRRAPACSSRAPPGLAPPLLRAVRSRGPTGPAAARRAAPGSDGRASTTRGSRATGRLGPPGAAAWHRGVPPPRAPAADRARSRPVGRSAGSTALARLPSQGSDWRLGGQRGGAASDRVFFIEDERRRSVLRNHFFSFTSFPIFSSSNDKTTKDKNTSAKTSIHLRRRHVCSLVAFDVLIESRFQLCPAEIIESCHGSDGGMAELQTQAAKWGKIHSEVCCVCVCH